MTKKIRNIIIISSISIIVLLTQLFIWNHSKINATGFDYIYNNSLGVANAQLKTEDEYYYNQIDNEFSYYQLNNNIFNLSNYKIGNMNNDGWKTYSGTINYNNDNGTFSYSKSNWVGPGFTIYMESGYTYIFTINITDGSNVAYMGLYRQDISNTNKYYIINSNWGNKYIFNCTITSNYLWVFENSGTSNSTISYNNAQVIKYLTTDTNRNDDFRKYTGLNNGYNINFYGRLYDIKPNTKYTLFTGSSGNDSTSMDNIYLSKNCISANISQCQFNYEISDITYNENNGSYTFLTPNYNDFKGVYYLVSDKANNAHFPTITGNMALYEGILDKNKSYYTNLEQNYYIRIKIENITKNSSTNNYLFNGRNIYNSSTNVGLIKFNLTRYTMEGPESTYKYYMLGNESYTNPGYYTYNIPNLFDLNLDNLGNIKGSMPSIEFENYSDWSSSSLASHHPTLSANWITKNQYMSNVIGFVGNNVYKGFYPGYGYGINNVDFNQNFQFEAKGFRWDQFTSNMYINGNNNNQLGFWFLSLATRNTIFDNNTLTPPNSSGFGNSNYEVYNACDGNIIEDFGCHLSNGITYVIFHIPVIGPLVNFIKSLIIGIDSMIGLINVFKGFGIMFGIFILFMAYCIIRKIYNK